MTSSISGCAATDSTVRAIEASSFRAGMMAETTVEVYSAAAQKRAFTSRMSYYRCWNHSLKRKLNTALVLIFIAGLLYMFARADYRQGEPTLRGQPEKDFALNLDGKPAHLSDLRGQVVLLNFWATWCPPCVDEAPPLNALQRRIAPLGAPSLATSPPEHHP